MKTRYVAVVVAFVAGCAPLRQPVPVADEAMAARSGVPLSQLQKGNAVYLAQCGRCHELVPPAAVKAADWKLLIPGMCWNAGLTRADEALVAKYVFAAKSR